MPPKQPNRYVANAFYEKFDVYVGRGHNCIWGNHFTHKPSKMKDVITVDTLEESLFRYRAWLNSRPALLARVKELKGKVLGCYCRPERGFQGKLLCHGQILAAIANGINETEIV